MPRRTKEEALQTRENLLKAGLSVFARKGYALATLEDVAREAAVTRGAVYWHFGSKAELFTALLDRYASLSQEIVQAAAAEGGSLPEILERVFIRQLEAVEQMPDLKAVMEISLFKTGGLPELDEALKQRQQSSQALIVGLAGILQQGINAGLLRGDLEAVELARAFLAFQNGLVQLWLQEPRAFSLAKSAPHYAQIYLNGIRRQEGSK